MASGPDKIDFNLLGETGHVHTFHNEMTPRPDETTCGPKQVRGHR